MVQPNRRGQEETRSELPDRSSIFSPQIQPEFRSMPKHSPRIVSKGPESSSWYEPSTGTLSPSQGSSSRLTGYLPGGRSQKEKLPAASVTVLRSPGSSTPLPFSSR